MERELFSKYLKLMEVEEESLQSLSMEKMSNYNIDVEHCQDVVVNVSSMDLMKKYENFFCDGKYGGTAAYWAIYVNFINRVNRQLQRAVHTNDVDGYIHVLSSIILLCTVPTMQDGAVFYSTNYSRRIPKLVRF